MKNKYIHFNVTFTIALVQCAVGQNPPLIGPGPSRIEKLVQMALSKNLKEVMSFLGLVKQLSKYSSNYAMITTKIRTLLHKNTKFIWIKDHQDKYDKVISVSGTGGG